MSGLHSTSFARAFVAAASLLFVWSRCGDAQAFERQWHVGGGAGLAGMTGTAFLPGPALGLHAAYGLSDVFDAHLEASLSRHRYEPDSTSELFWTANLGLVYKLDVIEWIPYGGLALGYHSMVGKLPVGLPASPSTGGLDVSLVFGIDYALSRSFALGGQFRQVALQFSEASLGDLESGTFSVGLLRAEYRWGY